MRQFGGPLDRPRSALAGSASNAPPAGLFSETIPITACADAETAITPLQAEVSDLIVKPFRANQILSAVERTLDRKYLRRDNALLRWELHAECGGRQLLGTMPQFAAVREVIKRVSHLPIPVLSSGANGTGEELAARHLHEISDPAGAPFLAVHRATIAPDRIAEEFFGIVEQGTRLKPGLLPLADGGTPLVEEVAQTQVQAEVLRVLAGRKVRPVRTEREIPLNLRFLFAANADLNLAAQEGTSHADLYHRINVLTVAMPFLRDRSEDIVELASDFVRQFSTVLRIPSLGLGEPALLKVAATTGRAMSTS